MPPTFSDLEKSYFHPILNATTSPQQASQLTTLQCNVIDMLRSLFAVCHSEQATNHALALSLTVPHLRRIWETARTLGLPTPLETHTA